MVHARHVRRRLLRSDQPTIDGDSNSRSADQVEKPTVAKVPDDSIALNKEHAPKGG
jgi:hypothetical protein